MCMCMCAASIKIVPGFSCLSVGHLQASPPRPPALLLLACIVAVAAACETRSYSFPAGTFLALPSHPVSLTEGASHQCGSSQSRRGKCAPAQPKSYLSSHLTEKARAPPAAAESKVRSSVVGTRVCMRLSAFRASPAMTKHLSIGHQRPSTLGVGRREQL